MKLFSVLFVVAAANLLTSGNALSNSDTISRTAPSADLVHSVDLHQPAKRVLRIHHTNDEFEAGEERGLIKSWRKKMVNNEQYRENTFTNWFETGVSVDKAKKLLKYDKKTDYHDLVEKYRDFRIALNMP